MFASRTARFELFLLFAVALGTSGCPMDRMYPIMSMRNDSDREIKLFLNMDYPDSTLAKSAGDTRIKPGEQGPVGAFPYPVHDYPGVTIFVFDYQYWRSRWHEGVGNPDTYLEESKILKKFYLSREQVDSTGEVVVFPGDSNNRR